MKPAASIALLIGLRQVGGLLQARQARLLALLLLALVGARRAAGAAPHLDRAGGVAAVLGPALALGLCHQQ